MDFEIISYLKESHPDLYRSLRRAVRSKASPSRRRARNPCGEAFCKTSGDGNGNGNALDDDVTGPNYDLAVQPSAVALALAAGSAAQQKFP